MPIPLWTNSFYWAIAPLISTAKVIQSIQSTHSLLVLLGQKIVEDRLKQYIIWCPKQPDYRGLPSVNYVDDAVRMEHIYKSWQPDAFLDVADKVKFTVEPPNVDSYNPLQVPQHKYWLIPDTSSWQKKILRIPLLKQTQTIYKKVVKQGMHTNLTSRYTQLLISRAN